MDVHFLVNLGAALLMGVIIGLERQYRQHPAGLRTNALVCAGAALYTSVPGLWGHDLGPDHLIGQIVVGVGFLGAGVIMHEGANVHGLNTAATLWCSAAVGALSGAGYPLYAAVGLLVVLIVHLGLWPVARWIDAHTRKAADVETSYRVSLVCDRGQEALARTILMRHVGGHPNLVLQGIATRDGDRPDQAVVSADLFSPSRAEKDVEELISRLNAEPAVVAVRWERGH